MDSQDIVGLVLVYAIIGASLAVAMAMERRDADRNVRKVLHIGVGLFVFVWWMFSDNWIMFVFFALPFAIVLLVAMFKDNAISESRLGDIANNQGHRTGLFLYVVSIGVLIVFFWDHWTAASVGVVAMTWGDGLGSVIGKRYGRHRTLNGKSVEGSLTVFAATAVMAAVVIVFYAWLTASGFYPTSDSVPTVPVWMASVIAGLIATTVEALCPGQFDNLAMPLLVACAMVLLGL